MTPSGPRCGVPRIKEPSPTVWRNSFTVSVICSIGICWNVEEAEIYSGTICSAFGMRMICGVIVSFRSTTIAGVEVVDDVEVGGFVVGVRGSTKEDVECVTSGTKVAFDGETIGG